MLDVLGDLNWPGIPVGFIALTLLGGLWFAALFPKAYNRSLGRGPDTKAPSTPLFLAGPPITSRVITLTSAILFAALDIDAYGNALLFGLIVGVGYLAANTVTNRRRQPPARPPGRDQTRQRRPPLHRLPCWTCSRLNSSSH